LTFTTGSSLNPLKLTTTGKNSSHLTGFHDTSNMPTYRYSILQNDLDDDKEKGLQEPSAVESSSPKDSYRIRLFIACGIILMIVFALLVLT
jgi:hypothetical protein